MVGQRVSPDETKDAENYWGAATFEKVGYPVALGLKGTNKKGERGAKRLGSLGTPRPEVRALADDFAPVTIITHVRPVDGSMVGRGTTTDNGTVKKVLVNGVEAKAIVSNFAEWEVTLKDVKRGTKITAQAEDAGGNVEKRAHVRPVK
jgi:hypothetical protein